MPGFEHDTTAPEDTEANKVAEIERIAEVLRAVGHGHDEHKDEDMVSDHSSQSETVCLCGIQVVLCILP
jgi:hypothetical protein